MVAALAAASAAPAATPTAKQKSPVTETVSAPVKTEQFDFGMVVKAQGGGFKNFLGVVTVPADWPDEQRVRVVKEDLPPGTTVNYKSIADVGRQMTVKIPFLPVGKETRAVVTFEVASFARPLPISTEDFDAADPETLEYRIARHLEPSPLIESDHPHVIKAAREASTGQKNVWDKAKAIHGWVYEKIRYSGEMRNSQTCILTLARHEGVCAEKNSLAVAMLRAIGLPARLVRVPGHCYYEVYLLDSKEEGHWLPGDASAYKTLEIRQESHGAILQKGDNVNMVDPKTRKRTKGRFLSENATGLPQVRGATLQFQPITPAASTKPKTPGQ